MHQAFSKIWIPIILVILTLVVGGFFAWQYFGASQKETTIDKDIGKAIELVKDFPEVKEWLALFPGPEGTSPTTGGKPAVEFDHKEGDKYIIHTYEVVPTNGHTATFNWYTVDLVTGEIRNFFGDIVFRDESETADWRTYRNAEYGFEVKYPTGWAMQIRQDPTYTVLFESRVYGPTDIDLITGEFYDTGEQLEMVKIGVWDRSTVEAWFETPPDVAKWLIEEGFKGDLSPIVETDLKIDGEPVHKFSMGFPIEFAEETLKETGEVPVFSYIVFRGEKAFTIEQSLPSECTSLECKIFTDIFSTFKFIENKITIISPAKGEQWKIGENSTIKLNKPVEKSNVFQHLTLNSADGEEIGIISCKIGATEETIFEWDTKTVLNYCGAGLEEKTKEIVPGTYKIAITEDVSGRPVISESELFSIVEP